MMILSNSPIAFSIGELSVYWYGIIYAISLFAAWGIATYILRDLRRDSLVVPTKEAFDSFMFWTIICIIVGARLGHILFFDFEYYFKNPIEILMIRNGGLSFHGAVISLGLFSYFYMKRKKMNWKIIADTFCIAGSLGIGIGRFANFFNHELYGKICTEEFAVIFSNVDSIPRYPTQVFEALFEGFLTFLILFSIFRLNDKKLIGSGVFCGLFCIIYSAARFVIEFYKDVEVVLCFNQFYLTVGQILSITMFVFGFFIVFINKNTLKNN